MDYEAALQFLASKILKIGVTTKDTHLCLVPGCYSSDPKESQVVAAHDALADRLPLDGPITHYKLDWINAGRGLVALSLYRGDGYGAASNLRLIKQECVQIDMEYGSEFADKEKRREIDSRITA